MNGHCDFHTFERAVDVCDRCYGDLCRSCALALKGRGDRVCKDCALAVSGVRGGGKLEVRGDRRTIKERRQAYATAEPPKDYFEFFDTDLPDDAFADPQADDDATQTGSGGGETGIKRLLGRLKSKDSDLPDGEFKAVDDVRGDDEESADSGEVGPGRDPDAVSQLADIRRQGDAALNGAGPAEGPAGEHSDAVEAESSSASPTGTVESPPIPASLLEALPDDADLRGIGQSPTGDDAETANIEDEQEGLNGAGQDPGAVIPEDGSGAATVAVDLPHGERRQKVDPVDDASPSGDTDEGPRGAPDDAQAREPDMPQVSPHLRSLVSDLEAAGSTKRSAENPFRKQNGNAAEVEAAPDFSTDPFADQGVPDPVPADCSTQEAPRQTQPEQPHVAQSHPQQVQPQAAPQPAQSAPQAQSAAVAPPPPAATATPHTLQPAATPNEPENTQPVAASSSEAPGERADTDARGSWIPPVLRGIAPDAAEAGDKLPRRRRSS